MVSKIVGVITAITIIVVVAVSQLTQLQQQLKALTNEQINNELKRRASIVVPLIEENCRQELGLKQTDYLNLIQGMACKNAWANAQNDTYILEQHKKIVGLKDITDENALADLLGQPRGHADINPALSNPQGQGQVQTTNSTTNTNASFSNPLQPYSSTPPQLQILGTNSFYDKNQRNPALHIVGEVLNYGTQTAPFVSVEATLYDANNRVVGVGTAYTNPSHIMPSKKAPFEIVVNRNAINGGDFRNVHHFSLQLI